VGHHPHLNVRHATALSKVDELELDELAGVGNVHRALAALAAAPAPLLLASVVPAHDEVRRLDVAVQVS
jgi:hypothetical protein